MNSDTEQRVVVSVVIPTFNRRAETRRAVESVLGQSIQRLEVIVVDDGSTPPISAEILGTSDPRLHIIHLEGNRGGAHARNIGVQSAIGEYIAFLDSDDYWVPAKLAHQLAVAEDLRGDVSWLIYNAVKRVERHKSEVTPRRAFEATQEQLADFLIVDQNIIQTSGFFMPIETARRFPFNESLRRHQDLDLLLNMAEAGVRFIFCSAPNVVWYSDATDKARVSSSPDATPTISWVKANRHRLSRRAVGEMHGVLVAPRLWHSNKPLALYYFLGGVIGNPSILKRAVSKVVRKFSANKGPI